MEISINDYIRQHYANTKTSDIAAHLGISVGKVYRIANNLGLKKSKEYMKQQHGSFIKVAGASNRYKKGHTPWNKGKKVDGTKIPDHTKFQKGQFPHNHKPVGWTRVDIDGYTYMKVAEPKTWKMLHVLIYEEEHGKIPKGKIVTFKDGNKSNFDIDNLELIDRKQHMLNNTLHRYPKIVVAAIKTISKLKKLIKNHGKEQN